MRSFPARSIGSTGAAARVGVWDGAALGVVVDVGVGLGARTGCEPSVGEVSQRGLDSFR